MAATILATGRKHGNHRMTSPHGTGNGSQLPGNDGSWFLKAVGVTDTPTTLSDVGGGGESTTELVSELWTRGERAADPFDGWVPDELSHTVDDERRFRWSTILGLAVVLALLVVGGVWLVGSSDGRAAARADDYRRVLIDLRADLPDAQSVLAQVTEPAADATQFADLIPTVADLRADAESALDVAAEPLPTAWPLASSKPFEVLEPVRQTTSQQATTAQAIARRLGEVLDYRSLFARFLDTGDLPSRPETDLSELNLRLAAAAADSASILNELPADAALAPHAQLARNALERFTTWQVDYVDALRTDSTDEVAVLLDELAAIKARLDEELIAAVALIRSEVDASIIDLAAALDAAVTTVP